MPKHPAEQYIEDILDGSIPSCRLVRLAVERCVRDFDTGAERGLTFDPVAAQHGIDFAQFCRHSKGEWAGDPLILEPWQQFIDWNIFGWRRADGTRRFRKSYVEVARKNGKSTWWAEKGLYFLIADGEPGAEVYTAATKFRQAQIIHGEAVRMVKASTLLRSRVAIFKDNLNVEATNSKFEPLPEKVDHGFNISCGLIDELHEHHQRDTWDVITTSTGSRRQPFTGAITTAGFDRNSICFEQREYVRQILLQIIQDDAFFGIIYTLDTPYDWPELVEPPDDPSARKPGVEYGDDWRDPAVWIKANPNLGISKRRDYLEENVREAMAKPGAQNNIMRLDFDIWTQASVRWISPLAWQKCNFPVDEEALAGRRCYGGLDLSSSLDITAFVLIFPPERPGEKYVLLPRLWIPQDNMLERIRRDRVPYDVWWKQGFITPTPGNVIDYDYIIAEIEGLGKRFDIVSTAFDRWGSTMIVQRLQELFHDDWIVECGQGFASMNAPMKEFEVLLLSQQLAHGGNPVLTWMADNIVARTDPAGNIKPDKERSTEKIDGIVAAIMALRAAGTDQSSAFCPYDEPGNLFG